MCSTDGEGRWARTLVGRGCRLDFVAKKRYGEAVHANRARLLQTQQQGSNALTAAVWQTHVAAQGSNSTVGAQRLSAIHDMHDKQLADIVICSSTSRGVLPLETSQSSCCAEYHKTRSTATAIPKSDDNATESACLPQYVATPAR